MHEVGSRLLPLMLKIFFSGSYIYIEASSPRVLGDNAVLKAGLFSNDVNLCFTFHYHMFGSDIGSLSVYQALNRTEKKLIWTKNSSMDDAWKTAWIDIRSSQKFHVSGIDTSRRYYQCSSVARKNIRVKTINSPVYHSISFSFPNNFLIYEISAPFTLCCTAVLLLFYIALKLMYYFPK